MAEEIMDVNEDESEDTQKDKFMTFKSGNEEFAIELQYVSEIVEMQRITEIPETEDYIKGLINLRGKIIPVIDVRIRFKQDPIEYTDRTCIIITNIKSTVVGLIVEKIAGVVTLKSEDIVPPPQVSELQRRNKYVYGLGKSGDSVKLLLSPEKLIRDEDMETLEEMADYEEN
ncbi:purine-binding chemotaxis protein CheW [Acetitomaculum ruminis DSM 5522]|uniref:Purine-binding chemotaxis protein CheW n=1 Tax=Acetitomaculum ruminis DSM 5522 TaxID=1120918 RepID=A0A1I0WDE2_9FIRM|nr:chemotaxis protein CheW [Acetitomaculum ruminis]SFA86651.1 purine-binding chemotaxis protein CheW [Acetitomaculum ruminis DSM 5522]